MTNDERKIISPFPNEAFSSTKYPFARVLRTSLMQKFKDAFYAFAGKFDAIRINKSTSTKHPHVGIFDYFTLFIPMLLAGELLKANNGMLKALGRIVNFFLTSIRYIVSAAAVILFSPVVVIVHGIAQLVAGKDYDNALSLKDKDSGNTLAQYLENNKMDINDLQLDHVQVITPQVIELQGDHYANLPTPQSESNPARDKYVQLEPRDSYQLELINKKSAIDNNLSTPAEVSVQMPLAPKPFVVDVDRSPDANVHAFFRLNIGKSTTTVEKDYDKTIQQFLLSI